jgi:menaquinone reductase, molybdopterin-binding-like subunit
MSRSKPAGPVSRREALAALGAVGASAAAGCKPGWSPPEEDPTSLALAKPHVPGAEAWGTHEERWLRSSCGQCPAGCGIRVRVVEGRAVRVEGDRENPLNRGGLGPRGLASLQGLYDPDRLTGPRKRVGGVLSPISWDDALGELTDALARLRAEERPDRLLVWCGQERGLMHDLWARFARAFGTPNFIDGRPGRTGVLAQAMEATIGVAEIPVYGWERAQHILSLEAGLLEDSCQSVYFTRVAAHLRRGSAGKRARLVHAGPMLDLCALSADEWVRIRPGQSGALALGLCHVLLSRHPEEAALPPDLTGGAEELSAFVRGFPPERVAALTGIEARTIERLAEELWEQRPSIAVVDERSLGFSNGLETAMAAMALNAVLGAFWGPAPGVRAAPTPPFRDWPEIAPDAIAQAGLARARLDRAGDFGLARSVHETLPEALAAAGDDRPEVALLYHANPAYARQQPRRWRDALAEIPLVVSFSPYRDETVEAIADLVLPDHTFLERWEITVPAPALDRAIASLRTPAIAPLHDTRATGDVVLELAARLGEPMAGALPWSTYREATEVRLQGLCDARRGSPLADSTHTLLSELGETGFWIDDEPTPTPPPRVTLHAAHAEPAWHGDPTRFPLRLLVYRPPGYAEGSGANLPWLRTLRSRPGARPWQFAARVNPASAPGLRDGDELEIESPWGSIRAALELDERMEPGYVAVPMGAGHDAFGRWARGFGANVLDLLGPEPAPASGTASPCSARVRITATRRRRS